MLSASNASRLALGVILCAGFALRFRAANHPYISQWDEAYHALVAKNLAAHPMRPTLYDRKVLPADDRDWTRAGVWLHKPPLPLWLMAAGIKAFGEVELSFRLPAVLLDTGVILLLYLLAAEGGLVAAGLYAINPLMIRLVSGRIPDDTPHVINVFFIVLTVFLFSAAARKNSRAWAAGAGLSLGLGTLCMSAVAFLGLAAALPLMRSFHRKLAAASIAAFVAAALPWPWYAMNKWPDLWRHENALHIRHLFSSLEGHAHSWWWYLKIFAVQQGGVPLIAWGGAAAAVIFAFRRGRNPGAQSALAWLLIPYAFFSLIATKMYSYTAVAVPAVCLLQGGAVAALWGERRRPVAAAFLIVVATQIALVSGQRLRADYSLPPTSYVYDHLEFRRVMLKLREVEGPKILLGVADDKSPQAMYYSETPSYPDAPTAPLARELLRRGFKIFVLVEAEKPAAAYAPDLKTPEFRGKIFYVPVHSPLFFDGKHPYES